MRCRSLEDVHTTLAIRGDNNMSKGKELWTKHPEDVKTTHVPGSNKMCRTLFTHEMVTSRFPTLFLLMQELLTDDLHIGIVK